MIKKKLNAVWNFMEKSMPSIEFVFPGQDKPVVVPEKIVSGLCDNPKILAKFIKTNLKGKENDSKPSKMDRSDSK